MENMQNRLAELTRRFSLTLAYLGALSAVLLVLIVSYGVFMRFVVGKPQTWTDQMAEYCLLWIVFFGLAYTLVVEGHVRMELVLANVGKRAQKVLQVFAHLVGCLFAAGLFLGVLNNFETFWSRNTISMSGLPIPLWIPAIPTLLGSFALFAVMFMRLLEYAFDQKDPSPENEEVDPT